MGTTTSSQSVPGNSSNEGVPHNSQISRASASPSDTVKCHTQDIPLLEGGLTPQ